jgi:hypothetical protein
MAWLIAAGVVIVVEIATALWFWRAHWLPDRLHAAISAIPQGDPAVIVATATPIVVLVATALWWLWWRLPKRQVDSLRLQVRDAKSRADLEDSLRKSISQVIGGAAVLVGAGFAYYQFLGQQQTSQKQLKASYDQLISQQVSKGFEQLSSDKITMRLGGVYALEGVMNNSEQYHEAVLEALCAFVREGTKPLAKPVQGKASKFSPGNSTPEPSPLSTDIQAALTVIGRRVHTTDTADLDGANLHGARLEQANLSQIGLSKTNLSGANLRGANLMTYLGQVDLSGADLFLANLSDSGMHKANMSGAYLQQADLSAAYLQEANLSSASLMWANLSEAKLMKSNLTRANLWSTNLSGADLSGAKNVSQGQLDKACGDKETKLPPGLTIKRTCPEEVR